MSTQCLSKPGSRSGVAIIVALLFAFCLLIMFIGLFFQRKQVSQHNRINLQERQAFFAARAAVQHFLLKARLFPTELYDAVGFAQGKNPFCDFSEFELNSSAGTANFMTLPAFPQTFVKVDQNGRYSEVDMGGNPRYFYTKIRDNPGVLIRMGSYYNPDYRFLGPNFANPSVPETLYTKPNPPCASWKPRKFLEYFIRDCTNLDNLQPALEMPISPGLGNISEWDLTRNDGFPFSFQYRVTNVDIQAIEGMRRYNEEAIEINLEGTIIDFQGKRYSQTHKRIQKINRRGAVP